MYKPQYGWWDLVWPLWLGCLAKTMQASETACTALNWPDSHCRKNSLCSISPRVPSLTSVKWISIMPFLKLHWMTFWLLNCHRRNFFFMGQLLSYKIVFKLHLGTSVYSFHWAEMFIMEQKKCTPTVDVNWGFSADSKSSGCRRVAPDHCKPQIIFYIWTSRLLFCPPAKKVSKITYNN